MDLNFGYFLYNANIHASEEKKNHQKQTILYFQGFQDILSLFKHMAIMSRKSKRKMNKQKNREHFITGLLKTSL